MFHQCLRSSFSRLQGAIGPHLKPVAGDGEKGLSWEHSYSWNHLCPQSKREPCSCVSRPQNLFAEPVKVPSLSSAFQAVWRSYPLCCQQEGVGVRQAGGRKGCFHHFHSPLPLPFQRSCWGSPIGICLESSTVQELYSLKNKLTKPTFYVSKDWNVYIGYSESQHTHEHKERPSRKS